MRLVRARAFDGRNVHSHRPVVEMMVDLEEYSECPTDKIEGFIDRLIEALPQIKDHCCGLGRPGGFLERLREGTLLGHVVEHVALELQSMSGMPTRYGKTRQMDQSLYQVVFEYRAREAALYIAECAVEMVSRLACGGTYPVAKVPEEAIKIAARTELGPSTAAITKAAEARGIPVARLDDLNLVQLGYGKYSKRVESTITQHTSCIGVDICSDKNLGKRLLADAGIPVAPGGLAETEEEALRIAREIGAPVVMKPFNGNQGRGVTLNLREEKEIRAAYELASKYSSRVLVEKHIKGNHYRALVVGDKVVACSHRIPAYVTGDGIHTIRDLIHIVNGDPWRGEGHEKPLTRIKVDPVVLMVLARNNLDLDHIPSLGETIYLRENANLSTGGIALDATGEIHPENALVILRAARTMGLDVAGVDVVTHNINRPLRETGGAIIEVNAAPGLRMHLHPWQGSSRDVGGAIVDYLFPPGSKSRIPIVAVTGTNGKTTTCRIIAYMLGLDGFSVGLTTTDGIYIGGRKILEGDNAGPWGARLVLRDPLVEAAVLETARGGILQGGLAFDSCDVAVVTNIAEDHLGVDGVENLEDLAWVKGLVAESAHREGYVVLNADDPYCVDMGRRSKANTIYFSMNQDNLLIKRHMVSGQTAVFLRDETIVVSEKGKEWNLLRLKEIPSALQGSARHNVENCLSAAAAGLALGLPPYVIRRGLSTFHCDQHHNPGRFNVITMGDFRVLLDYGHNCHALSAVLPTARQMASGRLIGVVTCPGDRRNKDIEAIGRVGARYCDTLVFKEDADLRGRRPGEIAGLLVAGALREGISRDRIDVVLDEGEAVRHALLLASRGDLVVVFFEKYHVVLGTVEETMAKIEQAKQEKPAAIF